MFNLKNKSVSTFVFAIFLSTAIYIFLISTLIHKPEKYTAKILSKTFLGKEIQAFTDFENDGKVDHIRFDNNFLGKAAFIAETDGKLIYQKNFNGHFGNDNFYYIDDFNNDAINEIYVTTYRNDSLFLSAFFAPNGDTLFSNQFISVFRDYAGHPDFFITSLELIDFDNDNYKDVFINLHCAFTYRTRKQLIYNIHRNLVIEGPSCGVSMEDFISVYDINNDGNLNFFGNFGAYSNCPEDYFLSDNFLWFYVLEAKMNLLFPPQKIGKAPGTIKTRPFKIENENFIAVFKCHHGNENDSSFIAIYNFKGSLIKQKMLPYDFGLKNAAFSTYPENNPTQIALLKSDGTLFHFDQNLNQIKKRKQSPFQNFYGRFDINGDGKKEYILSVNNNERISILQLDLSNPVTIDLQKSEVLYPPSLIIRKDKRPHFAIQAGNIVNEIIYKENKWFKYRYLAYLTGWPILFFMVLFIGRIFQKIAIRHYETEKQMAALQISVLEKQLTPHFNLNVLNSIGALYESKNLEKAQYYLAKYGKLLQNLVLKSGEISTTIEEELNFTKNYLELERLRMDNRFDFDIINDTNYYTVEIPRMLIHTFCENAVKHGLKHKKGKGQLIIEFKRTENSLIIFISDNGIGREKAAQYSLMSTGKGLEIINKSLKLYFRIKGTQITYKITDIYNHENEAAGTNVEIKVPLPN